MRFALHPCNAICALSLIGLRFRPGRCFIAWSARPAVRIVSKPWPNLQAIGLDDFRLVKAIADARALPAAAVQIGINHSTVFRRLRQIEERLGVTLFERHRSGYALTPAGEEMVELARRLVTTSPPLPGV